MDFRFPISHFRLNGPRRVSGCSTGAPCNPKSQIQSACGGPKSASAFTLTELLVVISIIILVSLMTIPAMTPFFRGQRLGAGARIVQAAFVQARSVAIAHRAVYQLVFVAAENYMIVRHDESRYSGGESQVGRNIELPDRVQFSETEPTISFNPSGSTTLIAVEQIKIRDQAGTELILEVQPTTGIVRRVQ